MKAWVLDKNGADNLSLKDAKTPALKKDEILIKVKEVGINPVDLMVVDFIPVNIPKIIGAEFAGEVYKVGESVKNFEIGDRVTIYNRYFDGTCKYCLDGNEMLCDNGHILGVASNGGLAEYAAVNFKNVFKIPDSIDFDLAASLPVAALTSYNALIRAGLKKGELISILGASGNTGLFALQLAKRAGAKTVAVSNKSWLKEFGADYTFDYDSALNGIKDLTNGAMSDLVVNSLGEKFWDLGYSLLGKNGRLVLFGTENGSIAKLDLSALYSKQLSVIGSTGGSIKQFSELVGISSELKVKVYKKFSFDDAKEAIEAARNNRRDGRVMVEI